VSLNENKFDGVIAELRDQGLKVTLCSALNETWYIKDDGLFTGYIASGAELLELKSANKLNIRGIKSLG
jgi:predicted peroxiredoxin